ncbi:MAG: molybdopterin-binding/glycosyltransferase family 2 protein [Alphaproteobacteria bacterium]|nr:molybdopterin-binding/glycosyltransferase family 2 protein [Alphaproteobacteria bacterium]
MKFGRIPTARAVGTILAHGVSAGDVNFKKGRTLVADDIDALNKAGVTDVMAAELEPDDVPEDIAARRIGEALRGANTDLSTAMTGRTNLYAADRGLVRIDATRINAINAIHESITVATLAPFELVERRQMLATIKVIPFAAPEWAVAKAEALAAATSQTVSWTAKADHPRLSSGAEKEVVGGPPSRTMTPIRRAAVNVATFGAKRIALISTTLPTMKAALLDKNRTVLDQRLSALGSAVIDETRCAHDSTAIAAAIDKCRTHKPDLILIFGASATTDRADAVPAGLVAAGGQIEHFGMPVDPGNLLLLGKIAATPVVGLPGCARSPKLNGFDWVLQRLCADIPVTPGDITAMGVGGLLKEIPTRPQPRDLSQPKPQRAPKVAALVLAAGKSTRMGDSNKLVLDLHGKPMIARTVAAIAACAAASITVVTGHNADAIKAALAGEPVELVHNPHFAEGMSTSLKAGLAALPADADAVLICLGDMPAVTPDAIGKIIAAFNPTEGRAIVAPTFRGKRGNPVLFARAFFDEMRTATGDAGARALLSAHADAVYEVETDAGVLADADTPAAFAALKADLEK